jgi:hypothetical protein
VPAETRFIKDRHSMTTTQRTRIPKTTQNMRVTVRHRWLSRRRRNTWWNLPWQGSIVLRQKAKRT